MEFIPSAWEYGAKLYNDALARERQAKADAMAEEKFNWERENQQRVRQNYDDAQRYGRDAMEILSRAPEYESPFLSKPASPSTPLGGADGPEGAPAPSAVQPGANPVTANPVAGDAGNPTENNLMAQFGEGYRRMSAQRQLLVNSARSALAAGDRTGFERAAQAVTALDYSLQRAQVFRSTYENPEMAKQVAEAVPKGRADAIRAEADENGFLVLRRGDDEVTRLSREQLAMAATHMFDISNGRVDEGYKGLAAVSKELAEAIAARNTQTTVLASSQNEGLKYGLDAALRAAQTTQAISSSDNAKANADFTKTARKRAAEAAEAEKRDRTEERNNPWRREVREYAARLNGDVKDGTMTREQAEASIAQFASEKHADAIITKVMPRLRQAQRDGQLDAALEQLGSVGGAPPELVERARRRMGVAPQGGASAGSGARAPASRMAPPKTGTAAPAGRVSSVLPPEMITRNDDLRVMSDMRRMAALGDAQWERELAQERALQERAKMEQDMQQRFNNVNLYRR